MTQSQKEQANSLYNTYIALSVGPIRENLRRSVDNTFMSLMADRSKGAVILRLSNLKSLIEQLKTETI